MGRLRKLLAIGLFATVWSPARAGMPMFQQMTCPIGNEKFTYMGTASYSSWGSRPDGKPYGSWEFPMPLPECPKNRLVLYKNFNTDEIKALKSLVKNPEYVRLAAETSYYRAAWLMSAMNEGKPIDRLWMIAKASWQADGDQQRKARYQREFAEGVAALPATPEDMDWVAMSARAANAWRELGEFDHANAAMKAISLGSLDVAIPSEKIEGTTASGLGKIIGNSDEIETARAKKYWSDYLGTLTKVIARSDRSSEPLDFIPSRVAMGKCMRWAEENTGPSDPLCLTDEMRRRVTEQLELRKKSQLPPPIH